MGGLQGSHLTQGRQAQGAPPGHTHGPPRALTAGVGTVLSAASPSIVKALLLVYCHFILKGWTRPWCLSTAMQVMVRISVTTAVHWTNGSSLQTKAPAGRERDSHTQSWAFLPRMGAPSLTHGPHRYGNTQTHSSGDGARLCFPSDWTPSS